MADSRQFTNLTKCDLSLLELPIEIIDFHLAYHLTIFEILNLHLSCKILYNAFRIEDKVRLQSVWALVSDLYESLNTDDISHYPELLLFPGRLVNYIRKYFLNNFKNAKAALNHLNLESDRFKLIAMILKSPKNENIIKEYKELRKILSYVSKQQREHLILEYLPDFLCKLDDHNPRKYSKTALAYILDQLQPDQQLAFLIKSNAIPPKHFINEFIITFNVSIRIKILIHIINKAGYRHLHYIKATKLLSAITIRDRYFFLDALISRFLIEPENLNIEDKFDGLLITQALYYLSGSNTENNILAILNEEKVPLLGIDVLKGEIRQKIICLILSDIKKLRWLLFALNIKENDHIFKLLDESKVKQIALDIHSLLSLISWVGINNFKNLLNMIGNEQLRTIFYDCDTLSFFVKKMGIYRDVCKLLGTELGTEHLSLITRSKNIFDIDIDLMPDLDAFLQNAGMPIVKFIITTDKKYYDHPSSITADKRKSIIRSSPYLKSEFNRILCEYLIEINETCFSDVVYKLISGISKDDYGRWLGQPPEYLEYKFILYALSRIGMPFLDEIKDFELINNLLRIIPGEMKVEFIKAYLIKPIQAVLNTENFSSFMHYSLGIEYANEIISSLNIKYVINLIQTPKFIFDLVKLLDDEKLDIYLANIDINKLKIDLMSTWNYFYLLCNSLDYLPLKKVTYILQMLSREQIGREVISKLLIGHLSEARKLIMLIPTGSILNLCDKSLIIRSLALHDVNSIPTFWNILYFLPIDERRSFIDQFDMKDLVGVIRNGSNFGIILNALNTNEQQQLITNFIKCIYTQASKFKKEKKLSRILEKIDLYKDNSDVYQALLAKYNQLYACYSGVFFSYNPDRNCLDTIATVKIKPGNL